MTWKVTMKKWAWTEHFWIISGSLRAPGWQAPSRYSYPAMELTAQIEGVSSPSPKRQVEADGPASETSQRRLYPPWAVLSRGALAAGAHGCLLCGTYTARLTQLTGLVTLRAEPQPEPKLTPAPMILTTGVSAWSMFAFSSATSGPAHPLSLLCEASHNAWPAISIYWRSEPAPLSFENSFLNCTLHSLSGKPGKFIVQDFVSNVTLRDQFKPKLQLFFPRWLQSGMEPALLSHSNRTVAGHGCPGRPHLPAPSSPSQPSPCCDLWPCDKALAKGMWVTAVCICPSGPQLWPHSSFPRDPPSSQSTVARATAVTSPVNSPLLQIIRPHPRPTEWETLFLGPSSHFTCTSASAAGDPYATPSLSTTAVRTPASTRMTARPQVEEQCVERSTGVCMTRCCITLHQSRPFAPKLLHEKKKLS